MAKVQTIAFTPDLDNGELESDYTRIPVSLPFLLVYAPESWHVTRGRLLPMLISHPLEGGVNRLRQSQSGKWPTVDFQAELAKAGKKMIPWSWGPDGNYVAQVETKTATGDVQTTYLSAFSTAYSGDSRIYTDIDAYNDWLESLLTSGKLPPCPAHRVLTMLSEAKLELHAAEVSHRKQPSANLAAKIDRLGKEIAVLEAALKTEDAKPRKKAKAKSPEPITE